MLPALSPKLPAPVRTSLPAAASCLVTAAMNDDVAQLAGALVRADRTADEDFEARLVESSTLAFRVAYSVLRHRQDAEDVAQEAFVKAYRCFGQLRDRERFRAWLVRMTFRLALDRRRGDKRRDARESTSQADGTPEVSGRGTSSTIDDDLVARERAAYLWNAIDALPDKLRVVIVLANIEGHGVSDVARLLGLREGTVKSRLFLARQRLKEHLQWMRNDPPTR
jgi:RNA polymerase sigma-70 factor, ECF subfamily